MAEFGVVKQHLTSLEVDGKVYNVALKTAEGTAKLYSELLRRTFASSVLAKLGFLLARSAFMKLKKRTDPRRYNGAMFLGLQGVCVKSHGGTDATGFANAVAVAETSANKEAAWEWAKFFTSDPEAASLVADSVANPARYWHNNVVQTLGLLDTMVEMQRTLTLPTTSPSTSTTPRRSRSTRHRGRRPRSTPRWPRWRR